MVVVSTPKVASFVMIGVDIVDSVHIVYGIVDVCIVVCFIVICIGFSIVIPIWIITRKGEPIYPQLFNLKISGMSIKLTKAIM